MQSSGRRELWGRWEGEHWELCQPTLSRVAVSAAGGSSRVGEEGPGANAALLAKYTVILKRLNERKRAMGADPSASDEEPGA